MRRACKNCAYCKNEYCTLEETYVDDINNFPCGCSDDEYNDNEFIGDDNMNIQWTEEVNITTEK